MPPLSGPVERATAKRSANSAVALDAGMRGRPSCPAPRAGTAAWKAGGGSRRPRAFAAVSPMARDTPRPGFPRPIPIIQQDRPIRKGKPVKSHGVSGGVHPPARPSRRPCGRTSCRQAQRLAAAELRSPGSRPVPYTGRFGKPLPGIGCMDAASMRGGRRPAEGGSLRRFATLAVLARSAFIVRRRVAAHGRNERATGGKRAEGDGSVPTGVLSFVDKRGGFMV